MANDCSSHSVFQIKSLDEQVEEHQAYKLRETWPVAGMYKHLWLHTVYL